MMSLQSQRTRHENTVALIAIVLVCLSGCAMPPVTPAISPAVNGYLTPTRDLTTLRRVVILLSGVPAGHSEVAESFRAALATELRAKAKFEVVTIDERTCRRWRNTVVRGSFHEQILVSMSNDYRADAVLFVGVNDYHPYNPPRISVTAHLVDVNNAVNLSSVDGVWDTSKATTAALVRQYVRRQSMQYSVPPNNLGLRSPRVFQQFVANQVVLGLLAPSQLPPVIDAGMEQRRKVPVVAAEQMLRENNAYVRVPATSPSPPRLAIEPRSSILRGLRRTR